jgi:hypothetical protein
MIIMYKFVREPTQWTIDRIDNIKGHNKNNIVLACLKCNLSRKCRSEQSFKMTKQMNLVLLNKNVGDNPDVGVGDCKSDLTENLVCGEIVEN